MTEIVLQGKTYPLATNLRVAYNVQRQHNHKSYMDIFQSIDEMTLEEQIGILYEAAKVGAQPSDKFFTREEFTDLYLDSENANVTSMMQTLKDIFEGILGRKLEPVEAVATTEEGTEGE